ncbi:hypothetical protein KKJ05_20085 [Xenorhabdus bovienii]|nr:hypothetical protein [Xenorhabdus bovienii]
MSDRSHKAPPKSDGFRADTQNHCIRRILTQPICTSPHTTPTRCILLSQPPP